MANETEILAREPGWTKLQSVDSDQVRYEAFAGGHRLRVWSISELCLDGQMVPQEWVWFVSDPETRRVLARGYCPYANGDPREVQERALKVALAL
jgi:hypothetical protein